MKSLAITAAIAGLLVVGCTTDNPEPPLAGGSDGQVSIGDQAGSPQPPGEAPTDEYIDPNAEALSRLGKLQSKHEYGIMPAIYVTDNNQTFVIWTTDRSKAQKLVNSTGYADQVQLKDTTVTLKELEAVQAKVDQIVIDQVPGDSIAGPDNETYPSIVAEIPADTPTDVVAAIKSAATASVDVRVILV